MSDSDEVRSEVESEVEDEVKERQDSDENPVESDKTRESSSSDSDEGEAEMEPEEQPKKKREKKKKDAEEQPQDMNEVDIQNPEVKSIEEELKVIFSKGTTKYKDDEDEDKKKMEIEKQLQNFLMRMDKAVDDDRESLYNGKRPFERLKFMKEIKKTLQNKELSRALLTVRYESKISSAENGRTDINTMHSHFLDYCAYFIQPIVIGSEEIPPIPGIISDMMTILDSMPWGYSSFQDTHIIQTLRKLPMKRGTELYIKREELLNKWMRIIACGQEQESAISMDEAIEDRGKKSRIRDEIPAEERWHEDELDILRQDAKRRSEYNVRDLQLEQELRKRRRAPGMKAAPEFRAAERFLVQPKMNTHNKKKVHGIDSGGGVARINRLLK